MALPLCKLNDPSAVGPQAVGAPLSPYPYMKIEVVYMVHNAGNMEHYRYRVIQRARYIFVIYSGTT